MGFGKGALEDLGQRQVTSLPAKQRFRHAYAGKRVLVTGHTGFKGSWLTLWLSQLGARVFGYALPPPTIPSMFEALRLSEMCGHREADVRNLKALRAALREVRPDFVFHLAAQPLVRVSYEQPIETIETNVLGTANLLEAIRLEGARCSVVVATSDKCYENREWVFGYREEDALGGHDVYSMSKGAAELVVASYRRSFFNPACLASHGVAVATARAGNVIGGGDWSTDRLFPDVLAALSKDSPAAVRNPRAVRPWQHVLEPLGGYLLLGASLSGCEAQDASVFCSAWNFGPRPEDSCAVSVVVEKVITAWGKGTWADLSDSSAPHEAGLLRLSIDKACAQLGWIPRWGVDQAIGRTVEWWRAYCSGAEPEQLRDLSLKQISDFENGAQK
jgi:CDP-glucose 4,6-dehydratase